MYMELGLKQCYGRESGGRMRESFHERWWKRAIACYGLALLATVLMLAIRRALDAVLGMYVPYLLVFPAIAFSSRYCGVGPTILTTVLGFLSFQSEN